MGGPRAVVLLAAALLLGGCAENVSWYLSINTYATQDTVPVGQKTGLYVTVSTNDGGAQLQSAQWTVVSAPGPWTLVAHGDHADFSPAAAGTYLVRFTGTYQTVGGGLVQRSGQVAIQASAPASQ